MKKIKVKINPNADTRTMTSLPTRDELLEINKAHIEEVSKGINIIIENLINKSLVHDIDKLYDVDGFLRDMKATWKEGKDFKELPWYEVHKEEEHHKVDWDENFDTVTLEDIIENIIDKLMATVARQGKLEKADVYKIADSIDSGTLKLGLINSLQEVFDRIEIMS